MATLPMSDNPESTFGARVFEKRRREKRVRNQSGGLLKEIGGLKIERILREGEALQRRGTQAKRAWPTWSSFTGGTREDRRRPLTAAFV